MLSPVISRFIARVVLRIRLARTLEQAVRFALAAVVLLCVGLAWEKFQPFAPGAWSALAAAAGMLVLAGTAIGLLSPVPGSLAARRADLKLGLEDRLSGAWEYAQVPEPTRFMSAHIAETARRIEGSRPGDAAPLSTPRGLAFLGLTLAMFGGLLLLPNFAAVPKSAVAAVAPAKLPPMRFAGERTVERLLLSAGVGRDAKLRDVLSELRDLYAGARAGTLSKEEALSRVGEIDAKLQESAMHSTGGETSHTWRREVERALGEKGKALREHPATADLGRALAETDLENASRESRSLAEQTKATPPAIELTKEQSDALKKILENAADAGGRKLDTLDRELGEAARALSADDLKKMAESFEAIARELDRMQQDLDRMKDMERVGEELDEMRETVAGLEQDGEGSWRLALGGGAGTPMARFSTQGADAPTDDDRGAPGVGNTSEGDGTGGEQTSLDSRRQVRKVSGQLGDGESLVQIVRGAASEGLAGEAYKDVVETASKMAEDAVYSEEIPIAYRLFIKRYFTLIAPAATKEDR